MFTNVLNADGVVAFGDTVYQYKGRYIKRTMNGFSNLTALKAATQSDSTRDIVVNVVAFSDEQRIEKEKNHVQTSTTPLTVTSTSDLVVFNDFQDAITNYSVGGTSRRVILTASLYSELYDIPERANFYHFNNVDFWFQARAEYKNFWGNWKPQEGGKGISSLTANYSWTAAILLNADNSPSIYNNIYVTDYTSGSVPNFSYPYLATSKPGTIRFDKTTGTPTNGYQIAPNGVYGPQFFNRNGEIRNGYGDQLYLDSKFTISQGLKLNSGAVFTCTVDGSNVTTILNWNK